MWKKQGTFAGSDKKRGRRRPRCIVRPGNALQGRYAALLVEAIAPVTGRRTDIAPSAYSDAESKRLTVHRLPSGENRVETVLIWRKGAHSPNIAALQQILSRTPARRPA